MDYALEGAKQAAAQMFDDIDEVTFIGELPTGERRYNATRTGLKDIITITVNPNHVNASIEWKHAPKERKSEYRLFRLQDLVVP